MARLTQSIVTTLALILVSCGGEKASSLPAADVTQSATLAGTTGQSDIVDMAVNAGQFKTLVKALKAADLDSTLRGPGPFTVFAPTDTAFEKLPKGTLEDLLAPQNKQKLRMILSYHVVAAKVPAQQAMSMHSAKTLEGQDIALSTGPGGGLTLNGKANVVSKDIMASNGIIHSIDAVLMPKE